MYFLHVMNSAFHLQSKGSQHDGAEYGVAIDSLEHVPFAMDLPGIDFVKQLHHDEHIKDDGVVLRWRRVEGSVAAAVDAKELLTYGDGKTVSIRFNHSYSVVCVRGPLAGIINKYMVS